MKKIKKEEEIELRMWKELMNLMFLLFPDSPEILQIDKSSESTGV